MIALFTPDLAPAPDRGNRVSEQDIHDYIDDLLGSGSGVDEPPKPEWGVPKGWADFLASESLSLFLSLSDQSKGRRAKLQQMPPCRALSRRGVHVGHGPEDRALRGVFDRQAAPRTPMGAGSRAPLAPP